MPRALRFVRRDACHDRFHIHQHGRIAVGNQVFAVHIHRAQHHARRQQRAAAAVIRAGFVLAGGLAPFHKRHDGIPRPLRRHRAHGPWQLRAGQRSQCSQKLRPSDVRLRAAGLVDVFLFPARKKGGTLAAVVGVGEVGVFDGHTRQARLSACKKQLFMSNPFKHH